MILKNIAVSNPFFHEKIMYGRGKRKKMSVSYPFLVYNRDSRGSKIFKSKINLFLSLQIQNKTINFFNIFHNYISLEPIFQSINRYRLKTKTIVESVHSLFFPTLMENKIINKIHNKNNSFCRDLSVYYMQNVLKRTSSVKSLDSCEPLITSFEKISTQSNNIISLRNRTIVTSIITYLPNVSLLSLHLQKQNTKIFNIPQDRLIFESIPDTITYINNLTSKNISQLNFLPKEFFINNFYKIRYLDALKDKDLRNRFSHFVFRSTFSYVESTMKDKIENYIKKIKNSNRLLTSKLLENLPDWSTFTFLNDTRFLNMSVFRKSSAILSNRMRDLNSKDSLNIIVEGLGNLIAESLDKRFFSNYNQFLKNINLLNRVHHLHITLFSKACNSLYIQNKDEVLINSFSHSVFRSKILYVENALKDKIEDTTEATKSSNRLLTSKLSENLLDWSTLIFLNNRRLRKMSVFQKNNEIFEKSLFSNWICAFKKQGLENAVTDLNSKDSSNIIESLGNRIAESLDKRFFSSFLVVRKRNELKIEKIEHDFAQNSHLKAQCLNDIFLKIEPRIASAYIHTLPVDNLVFPLKRRRFSIFFNQMPTIHGKPLLLSSFPDIDSGNEELADAFKKRKMLLTADNGISVLEPGKSRSFYANTENFIFQTQSEIEKRIEEKIEQKINNRIEQVKKAAVNVREEISEQSQGNYTRAGDRQKQQIDINYISDQVFRLMESRLRIERERRGIL